MNSSPPQVSLIISVYNQPHPLELSLTAHLKQATHLHEILIADDGSTNEVASLIQRLAKDAKCPVHHIWHADKGFRKNKILNQALAKVSGNYVVLTDADCVPHPYFARDHVDLAEPGHWVQGRRSYLSKNASARLNVGVTVQSLRLFLTGHLSGALKGFRFPYPLIRRDLLLRGIIGCNMGMWREDLIAINGWDEVYEGWGLGEDSDLGVRLYHLGRRRKFVYGRAVLYHLHHPVLSRDHLAASQARFEETLQTKKVRCLQGVSQYL